MANERRREDLAKRVGIALVALRPAIRGETIEATLARRAWTLLADIRAQLLDEYDDA